MNTAKPTPAQAAALAMLEQAYAYYTAQSDARADVTEYCEYLRAA
jgi:hypothetical protein